MANEIGLSAPRITDVVLGKRAISADTALRLGMFFGQPAQFWLSLQIDYDLRLAQSEDFAKIMPFRAPKRPSVPSRKPKRALLARTLY